MAPAVTHSNVSRGAFPSTKLFQTNVSVQLVFDVDDSEGVVGFRAPVLVTHSIGVDAFVEPFPYLVLASTGEGILRECQMNANSQKSRKALLAQSHHVETGCLPGLGRILKVPYGSNA